MIDFRTFIPQKFNELAEHFKKKNEQYTGTNADTLANFRIGAMMKYGSATMPNMYEIGKDYVRKHVAYIESHDINGKTAEDSLKDIGTYAMILLYMIKQHKQNKQERKNED